LRTHITRTNSTRTSVDVLLSHAIALAGDDLIERVGIGALLMTRRQSHSCVQRASPLTCFVMRAVTEACLARMRSRL
jgi:hypothetical protein